MGYQNNILIRTSLGDEGVIGKRQFSYQSPDMIAHTQVENPDEYFKGNYDKDVNMPLDKNSCTSGGKIKQLMVWQQMDMYGYTVAVHHYLWNQACGAVKRYIRRMVKAVHLYLRMFKMILR